MNSSSLYSEASLLNNVKFCFSDSFLFFFFSFSVFLFLVSVEDGKPITSFYLYPEITLNFWLGWLFVGTYRKLKVKSQILLCKGHEEVLGFILKMMESYYAFQKTFYFEIHDTF